MVGGWTLIIPCPHFSQAHHRRAISSSKAHVCKQWRQRHNGRQFLPSALPHKGSTRWQQLFVVSFLCSWGFAVKSLVQLRTVCICVARKRRILQLSSVWSRWTEVLQGTLLLIKLPRGCSSHSGRYGWSHGYVSSHLYWCHPPMSIIRGWHLLPHQSISHRAPLSLGVSWVCERTLNSPSWFVLFSWCYGGELVAQNMAVLL